MASAKILENKKAIVEEIKSNIQNSESVVIFTYQGLTVSELSLLRKELKKTESEVKVYKNTLFKTSLQRNWEGKFRQQSTEYEPRTISNKQ